jgi:hypothetical protein
MDYGHYDGLQGRNNAPGFKETLLVAPKSWITSLPSPPTASASPGDTATITGDITFDTGKGFVRMAMTQDSVMLAGEAVGDNADSIGDKITLNGFMPGLYAPELELNKTLRNEDLVILLQDCNGTVWALGCDCTPVKGKPSIEGGQRSGGKKGTNWEFTAFCAPNVYTGTITEKA